MPTYWARCKEKARPIWPCQIAKLTGPIRKEKNFNLLVQPANLPDRAVPNLLVPYKQTKNISLLVLPASLPDQAVPNVPVPIPKEKKGKTSTYWSRLSSLPDDQAVPTYQSVRQGEMAKSNCLLGRNVRETLFTKSESVQIRQYPQLTRSCSTEKKRRKSKRRLN